MSISPSRSPARPQPATVGTLRTFARRFAAASHTHVAASVTAAAERAAATTTVGGTVPRNHQRHNDLIRGVGAGPRLLQRSVHAFLCGLGYQDVEAAVHFIVGALVKTRRTIRRQRQTLLRVTTAREAAATATAGIGSCGEAAVASATEEPSAGSKSVPPENVAEADGAASAAHQQQQQQQVVEEERAAAAEIIASINVRTDLTQRWLVSHLVGAAIHQFNVELALLGEDMAELYLQDVEEDGAGASAPEGATAEPNNAHAGASTSLSPAIRPQHSPAVGTGSSPATTAARQPSSSSARVGSAVAVGKAIAIENELFAALEEGQAPKGGGGEGPQRNAAPAPTTADDDDAFWGTGAAGKSAAEAAAPSSASPPTQRFLPAMPTSFADFEFLYRSAPHSVTARIERYARGAFAVLAEMIAEGCGFAAAVLAARNASSVLVPSSHPSLAVPQKSREVATMTDPLPTPPPQPQYQQQSAAAPAGAGFAGPRGLLAATNAANDGGDFDFTVTGGREQGNNAFAAVPAAAKPQPTRDDLLAQFLSQTSGGNSGTVVGGGNTPLTAEEEAEQRREALLRFLFPDGIGAFISQPSQQSAFGSPVGAAAGGTTNDLNGGGKRDREGVDEQNLGALLLQQKKPRTEANMSSAVYGGFLPQKGHDVFAALATEAPNEAMIGSSKKSSRAERRAARREEHKRRKEMTATVALNGTTFDDDEFAKPLTPVNVSSGGAGAHHTSGAAAPSNGLTTAVVSTSATAVDDFDFSAEAEAPSNVVVPSLRRATLTVCPSKAIDDSSVVVSASNSMPAGDGARKGGANTADDDDFDFYADPLNSGATAAAPTTSTSATNVASNPPKSVTERAPKPRIIVAPNAPPEAAAAAKPQQTVGATAAGAGDDDDFDFYANPLNAPPPPPKAAWALTSPNAFAAPTTTCAGPTADDFNFAASPQIPTAPPASVFVAPSSQPQIPPPTASAAAHAADDSDDDFYANPGGL